jgi:hypothetical protein
MLIAGVALLAPAARADDCGCGFAFFRRCPAESGVQETLKARYCRPPRCPPYCDPNFGFYPTAWRAWPMPHWDLGEELPAPRGSNPAAPAGTAPGQMPPASDAETRGRSGQPGAFGTSARAVGALPPLSGATAR